MLPQPNDTTCGPTCLHAVYAFHGTALSLESVISAVDTIDSGGTLAVLLGCDALRRGYAATIYTCNLNVFDPTWFAQDKHLPTCLKEQARHKPDVRIQQATRAYLNYLELGGVIRYRALDGALIRRYLKRRLPILVGLSATYLYGCARELNDDYDDLRGFPSGHFVVIYGYDPETREAQVADPLQDNPGFGAHYYRVEMDRLISAILLGIVTYDANMLLLEPPQRQEKPR